MIAMLIILLDRLTSMLTAMTEPVAGIPCLAYAPGRRPDGAGFGEEDEEEDEEDEEIDEDDKVPAKSS